MKKYNYRCDCHVGNISILQTEMMKDALIIFLESFHCENFKKEKIDALNDGGYYYEFKIEFSDFSMLKVNRFSDALIQFRLFWKISIFENHLD